MQNIIELKKVNKTYRLNKLEVPVLHDIDLQISSGDMVAIVGPSGSGKSTLMNIIGLLDRPSSGEFWLKGEKITLNMPDKKLAVIRAKTIGFVFQSFNLLPKQNAINNVMLPASYIKKRGSSPKKQAEALLKKVGLEHRLAHRPTEMSGGEKQRIAIARALINNPEIILADEPTGNLDSKSGQQVIDILKTLHQEGKTVLIITHDEKVASQCQRTIRLFDGKVVEDKYVK